VPLAPKTRTILLASLPALAAVCAVFVFTIPPDERIGEMVRFVMFHGASTWVNMGTFTLAGVAGLAYLLGSTKLGRWGEAFRWIALPHWLINTVLGVMSMKLLWGGVKWDEPRLWMSFGLLGGSAMILAVQLLFDHPKIPAVLDAVLALSLWTLVLVLPNLFHPDSPVFSSGNFAFIGRFLGMVVSVAAIAGVVATLVARRIHPEHPHGHALP
jgi:hypothetical protein